MEFITQNAGETQQLAGKILKEAATRPHDGALVLALSGDLGAGKTTFIQGLAKALGIKEKILSPTFVIMKHFEIANSPSTSLGVKFTNLYHLDAYRLNGAQDLAGLGLEEILKDKNNLVVIEWAERVKDILPADTVWIKFEHEGEDRRKIEITNF